MRKLLILLSGCSALLAAPLPALAAPGTGCDGFLWPLTKELAWMKGGSEKVASGATLPAPPADKAIEVALQPASKVPFAVNPTSTPKPEDAEAFGGIVSFNKLPEAGHYQITLSGHGWIDVVQNGKPLEATAHTGAIECEWIRKSVRFEIGSGPFSVQVHGLHKDTVRFTLTPAAD